MIYVKQDFGYYFDFRLSLCQFGIFKLVHYTEVSDFSSMGMHTCHQIWSAPICKTNLKLFTI